MTRRKFHHRSDGYKAAIRIWTCKNCQTQHEDKKPSDCRGCGFNQFHYFASRHEADRYAQLNFLAKAGQIENLKTQVVFPLRVNGMDIGKYIADFQYKDLMTGQTVVEDTKGSQAAIDPVFKIKKKLMAAIHGVDIKLTHQSKARK